jgi:hypothetical protein
MTTQRLARNLTTRLRAQCLGLVAFCAPLCATALPLADTQGTVSAVRVVSDLAGEAAFQVWFSATTRDRFGCIATDGYITVRKANPSLSDENYNRIFAIALAAQSAGKPLALDSGGTDPCFNVSIGWMVD